jgi:glycosyltransferase involved in cell wall biosynthesis
VRTTEPITEPGEDAHLPRSHVTIVTPTLNVARYLPDCIRSVDIQRSALDVEHIVVDDGSTDGTVELATQSGARVVEGRREGLYAAMNQGLENATGDVVGVLNGDDYLYAGALDRLVTAMRTTGRPWAIGRLQWVDGAGRNQGGLAPPPSWLSTTALASLGWNWMHHQTAYLQRDFMEDLGGFDPLLQVCADYDLLIRARVKAPFAPVRALTAAFRRHGANISMTSPVAVEEAAEIRRLYGSDDPRRDRIESFGVRAYVNARNPRWALTRRLRNSPS